MIEFLKQRKIVIIIGILVILLLVWKFYDSSKLESIDENQILISKVNEDMKEEEEENIMAVHITGEVKNPGVIKISEGSRIEDQTTPNMIQKISGIFEIKPLISKEI